MNLPNKLTVVRIDDPVFCMVHASVLGGEMAVSK